MSKDGAGGVADPGDVMMDIGVFFRGLEKLSQSFHSDVNRVIREMGEVKRMVLLLTERVANTETVAISTRAELEVLKERVTRLESRADDASRNIEQTKRTLRTGRHPALNHDGSVKDPEGSKS